ncbi:bifunctional UDP-N-acetylglucosamine diphosphorylase/glucosamine-1-phosphate N-acetyltransferase GlmU [Dactylosporangium sp. NPDC051485]|uniref:bifunctional UDP-N-acetylglucosamine diphosphorylase/glucosamine-1-phosphate N-acetyltransferase GlmU n=1 Tax=Dactylosporangium sp. NPDC051485 TaxID=3154846 RepID=UPI003433F287
MRRTDTVEEPSVRNVIILAAGEGKRMKSSVPKVLHPLLGRTLLGHVLAAAQPFLGSGTVTVVVGHGGDQVREHLAQVASEAVPVTQTEQRGTGHAVRIALDASPELSGTVVVLNGDIPLLRAETLAALVHAHETANASATVLTAEVDNPTGLGRIVRDQGGEFAAIVEERDATPGQRAIREINSGAYVFEAAALREMLGKLSTNNDQGEEYLTDVIGMLAAAGAPVVAHRAPDATETLGANDRAELAGLRALMRDRINDEWMRAGVAIIDPATTWIDVTVTLERDAVIEPNTHLRGATSIGEAAVIGPDTSLIDVVVGPGAAVVRTHAVSSEIGPQASVGPFAYLRPGSQLGRKSKVGTFVETKAATLGEGAKVPHLSYVGDATIGEHTNIGAATVFVNYDGVRKQRSVIGAHARTGADNMFVAPVHVGDGAYTAAGSVIVKDIPPGALGVSRATQRNIEGWVERKRAGTAAAEAARGALAREENHAEAGQVAESSPRDEQ